MIGGEFWCRTDVGDTSHIADIGNEADGHADTGQREGPMPAVIGIKPAIGEPILEPLMLREKTGEQWCGESTNIDAHIKDGETGIAALITGRVETADHGADIRFQQSGADGDEDESCVKSVGRVNRHCEMARRDDNTAN